MIRTSDIENLAYPEQNNMTAPQTEQDKPNKDHNLQALLTRSAARSRKLYKYKTRRIKFNHAIKQHKDTETGLRDEIATLRHGTLDLKDKTMTNIVYCLKKVMSAFKLNIPVAVLVNALYDVANSVEDYAIVKKSQSSLHKIRQKNEQARTDAIITSVNNLSTKHKKAKLAQDYRVSTLALMGQRLLNKSANDRMVFYKIFNTRDHPGYKIVRAHLDGRLANAPTGYKQSLELRLVLQKDKLQMTVTFAFALVNGTNSDVYDHFFHLLQVHKCPPPPIFVTDFEIAFHSAIKKVFPDTVHQGCWFHYIQNLWSKDSKLNYYSEWHVNPGLFKIMSMLMFMQNREYVMLRLLNHYIRKSEESRFKDVGYKFIMYVYETYMKRLRNLFYIDLKKTNELTNNTCEGSNSAYAKMFPSKASLLEYSKFVERRAKKQLIQIPKAIPSPHTKIALFKIVQRNSHSNPVKLMDVLLGIDDIGDISYEEIHARLPDFRRHINHSQRNEITDSVAVLEEEASQYRKYISLQKLKLMWIKRHNRIKNQPLDADNQAIVKELKAKEKRQQTQHNAFLKRETACKNQLDQETITEATYNQLIAVIEEEKAAWARDFDAKNAEFTRVREEKLKAYDKRLEELVSSLEGDKTIPHDNVMLQEDPDSFDSIADLDILVKQLCSSVDLNAMLSEELDAHGEIAMPYIKASPELTMEGSVIYNYEREMKKSHTNN